MWYFQIFQRAWRKFAYTINQTKENVVRAIANQFSGIKVTEDMVKTHMKKLNLMDKLILNWTEEELKKLTQEFRKETKPIIVAANKIDVPGAYDNYEKLKKKFPDYLIIPCSAEAELALKEADKTEIINYVPGNNSFTITHPENYLKSKKTLWIL
jgi:ribosome-binding ATPase